MCIHVLYFSIAAFISTRALQTGIIKGPLTVVMLICPLNKSKLNFLYTQEFLLKFVPLAGYRFIFCYCSTKTSNFGGKSHIS